MSHSLLRLLALSAALVVTACHFTLDRQLAPGEIRGKLVYAGTTAQFPAAGAHVALENSSLALKADENGRFSFTGLPAGRYALMITASQAGNGVADSGLRLQDIVLNPTGAASADGIDLGVLEVGAFGGINGSISSTSGLADGATVVVPGISQTTADGGKFQVNNLPPGDYTLQAVARNADSNVATAPITIHVKPRVLSPASLNLDLGDATISNLTGSAMLAGASTNAGVTVTLDPTGFSSLTGDTAGVYVLAGIEPGVYTLTAKADGYEPVAVPFVVVAGMSTQVPAILLSRAAATPPGEVTVACEQMAECQALPSVFPSEASCESVTNQVLSQLLASMECASSGQALQALIGCEATASCGAYESGQACAVPSQQWTTMVEADPVCASIAQPLLGTVAMDGGVDAGSTDAGQEDAGSMDAGSDDAGSMEMDAGSMEMDAGPADAGSADAGPSCVPTTTCADQGIGCGTVSDDGCGHVLRCQSTCGTACVGGFCWEHPRPFGDALFAIGGISSSDLWVSAQREPTMLHYDGKSWTIVQTPLDPAGRTVVTAFWAHATNDVWAATSAGSALHWDGQKWSLMMIDTTNDQFAGVWGDASNDVWFAGTKGIFHWNGTGFTQESTIYASAVWGSGPGDVWATDSNNNQVLHSTGNGTWNVAFTPMQSPQSTYFGVGWSGGGVTTVAAYSDSIPSWCAGFKTTPGEAYGGVGFAYTTTDGTNFARAELATPGGYDSSQPFALSGTAPNDLWLANDFIYHFDGTSWTRAPLLSDRYFYGVIAFAKDDVWAVGAGSGGNMGEIAHYDGTKWTLLSGEPQNSVVPEWSGGAPEVWGRDQNFHLRHFDGDTWNVVPEAGNAPTCVLGGLNGSDVYATTGRNMDLWNWNGTSWQPVTTPLTGTDTTGKLVSVWASTPADVWLGGWTSSFDGVLHWDGTQWTSQPENGFPSGGLLQGIFGFNSNVYVTDTMGGVYEVGSPSWTTLLAGGAHNLYGATWMSSPTDVWFGTNFNHFDGSMVGPIANPPEPGGASAFWGSSPSDVWATSGFNIEHWDGTTWTAQPTPTGDAIEWLRGTGPTDIWAAGQHHGFAHYDGTSWTSLAPNVLAGTRLRAMYALDSTHAWAVGDNGALMAWDGSTWTPLPTHTGSLNGVWASGPSDVWAVAPDMFLHFDGATWTTSLNPVLPQGLTTIWGAGPGDAWALAGSMVLRLSGSGWVEDQEAEMVGGGASFTSISGLSSGEAWMVGSGGVIGHWTGTAWVDETVMGAAGELNSVSAVDTPSGPDVWAVGTGTTQVVAPPPIVMHRASGSWSVVPSPPGAGSQLMSVWAHSPTDVWVTDGSAIFRWDGATWTTVATFSNQRTSLEALTGLPSGDVWAVGSNLSILHYAP